MRERRKRGQRERDAAKAIQQCSKMRLGQQILKRDEQKNKYAIMKLKTNGSARRYWRSWETGRGYEATGGESGRREDKGAGGGEGER